MPRRNRVTPNGEIIATPARGTLMGNRGCLHNEAGQIKRLYQNKRWIFCRLQFKGRHRTVMTPRRYTELFFLDEATALAAGHRPCAECMRSRYKSFLSAWTQANPDPSAGPTVSAVALDAILHQDRLSTTGNKVVYPEKISRLPAGCFIFLEDDGPPYLLLEKALLRWSPHGYNHRLPHPRNRTVAVLTPRSIVQTLAFGFQPSTHPTATEI